MKVIMLGCLLLLSSCIDHGKITVIGRVYGYTLKTPACSKTMTVNLMVGETNSVSIDLLKETVNVNIDEYLNKGVKVVYHSYREFTTCKPNQLISIEEYK